MNYHSPLKTLSFQSSSQISIQQLTNSPKETKPSIRVLLDSVEKDDIIPKIVFSIPLNKSTFSTLYISTKAIANRNPSLHSRISYSQTSLIYRNFATHTEYQSSHAEVARLIVTFSRYTHFVQRCCACCTMRWRDILTSKTHLVGMTALVQGLTIA